MNSQAENNKKFENYYYDHQIVSYILQFMAVFSDMKIKIGKNDNPSTTDLVTVPIRYGDADRVVNNIIASYTTNSPIRVPMFSAYFADFQLRTEQQKGIGATNTQQFVPVGGSFPDDLQTVSRRVPTPYTGVFELYLYTSNNDQRFQILEQICGIFDPIAQFQISDAPFDWAKIFELKLNTIKHSAFPSDEKQRILITTFIFSTTMWMQLPISFKQDFIKNISMRISGMNQFPYIDASNPDNLYEEIVSGDSKNFYNS